MLAIITAGIAKITMNAVTTCAHTKIGMRLSDMPGRAHLEDGDDDFDRHRQRGDLGERDQLRPHVRALARRVLRPRERHVREPADVRPGVQHEHR